MYNRRCMQYISRQPVNQARIIGQQRILRCTNEIGNFKRWMHHVTDSFRDMIYDVFVTCPKELRASHEDKQPCYFSLSAVAMYLGQLNLSNAVCHGRLVRKLFCDALENVLHSGPEEGNQKKKKKKSTPLKRMEIKTVSS